MTLLAPAPSVDAALTTWLEDSGCLLGMGDGEGLAFAGADDALARRLGLLDGAPSGARMDVEACYEVVVAFFPETADVAAAVRAVDADGQVYPFLDGLLGPLLVNVGAHGSEPARRAVFECVDHLLTRHSGIANEIGAGIVEVAPDGWFEVARGWTQRKGRRTRRPDPYGVETAVRAVRG